MKSYFLDGAQMDTREKAHDYLAKTLEFPDYYGKNLDALYDCLTEMSKTEMMILYSFAVDDDIKRVMADAAEANPKLTVYMA